MPCFRLPLQETICASSSAKDESYVLLKDIWSNCTFPAALAQSFVQNGLFQPVSSNIINEISKACPEYGPSEAKYVTSIFEKLGKVLKKTNKFEEGFVIHLVISDYETIYELDLTHGDHPATVDTLKIF